MAVQEFGKLLRRERQRDGLGWKNAAGPVAMGLAVETAESVLDAFAVEDDDPDREIGRSRIGRSEVSVGVRIGAEGQCAGHQAVEEPRGQPLAGRRPQSGENGFEAAGRGDESHGATDELHASSSAKGRAPDVSVGESIRKAEIEGAPRRGPRQVDVPPTVGGRLGYELAVDENGNHRLLVVGQLVQPVKRRPPVHSTSPCGAASRDAIS